MERPDLSKVDLVIREYIERLESELGSLKAHNRQKNQVKPGDLELDDVVEIFPSEPPTTLQVITYTSGFLAKRSARHLYNRQRRGGMGVFDLDAPESDPIAGIAIADESQSVLLFTDQGRVFRIPVSQIPHAEVRDRGQVVAEKFALLPGEHLVSILPDDAKGAVALVSQLGYVRYLRHHIFGEYMKPGTNLLDVRKFGLLTAACHTSGDGDLFIASRQGKAIRFASKLIPPQGCSGMRLDAGDASVCITSVDEDSSVFMVDANGNGTIRSMAAFTANKSTGGGGKLAMKTEALVMASKVYPDDEIFLISRLSKIIRFAAHEVPVKEGVVQGVRCMALRADQVVAGLITQ